MEKYVELFENNANTEPIDLATYTYRYDDLLGTLIGYIDASMTVRVIENLDGSVVYGNLTTRELIPDCDKCVIEIRHQAELQVIEERINPDAGCQAADNLIEDMTDENWDTVRTGLAFCVLPRIRLRIHLRNKEKFDKSLELIGLYRQYKMMVGDDEVTVGWKDVGAQNTLWSFTDYGTGELDRNAYMLFPEWNPRLKQMQVTILA